MFKRKIKKASSDYDVKSLPKNRKEVFFDLLKIDFKTIFKNGLTLLVFSLPFIINYLLFDIYYNELNNDLINNVISLKEFESFYVSYNMIESIINIPFLIIIAFGISGLLQVNKLFVFYEPRMYIKEFIKGIKINIKHVSFIFLLIGVLNVLLTFIKVTTFNQQDSIFYTLLKNEIPRAIVYAIFIPVFIIVLYEISLYDNKLKIRLKNSFIIYMKTFLKTILLIVLFFLPLLLMFIPSFTFKMIFLIIYVILYLPIVFVIWHLYFYYLFDEFINKEQFKELVNKGVLGLLYNKEENKEGEIKDGYRN